MKPYKLAIFLLGTLLLASFVPPKKKVLGRNAPPNIILIFTDDQGYNDVGVFGSTDIETPNLDALARKGVRLTNFYAAQAVCSASRAALLTGTYPNRIGIHGALWPSAPTALNLRETTIAEMLKPLGYATGAFGKWHLGSTPEFMPTRQGFDTYFGIPYSGDMWPKHPTDPNYPPLPLYENETRIQYLDDQTNLTQQITQKTLDFMEQNKARPFFAYVPFPQPHVPLFASDKFRDKSKRGLYGDVINEIDDSIGRMWQKVKDLGLEENTIIIFTSDNGPWLSYGTHSGSAFPLREGKGTAWEGGVREPFIMYWKNHIEGGKVVATPAMTIDILPTLARITRAALPTLPIDGKNILPILEGRPNAKSPQEAYYFYYNTNELQAVRSGKWKLIFPHSYRTLNGKRGRNDGLPIEYVMRNANLELYDLEHDMSETTNVASQNPDVVARLNRLANRARFEMGDALTKTKGTRLRAPGRVHV